MIDGPQRRIGHKKKYRLLLDIESGRGQGQRRPYSGGGGGERITRFVTD